MALAKQLMGYPANRLEDLAVLLNHGEIHCVFKNQSMTISKAHIFYRILTCTIF
jgi:hypothetical protein